jgi:hypothetical protein
MALNEHRDDTAPFFASDLESFEQKRLAEPPPSSAASRRFPSRCRPSRPPVRSTSVGSDSRGPPTSPPFVKHAVSQPSLDGIFELTVNEATDALRTSLQIEQQHYGSLAYGLPP